MPTYSRSQKSYPKRPQTVIAVKPPSKLQRIAKDVSVLKRNAKKEEYKFFDISLSQLSVDTATTVQLINAIPSGISGSNFTGTQYTVKSIELKGFVILEDATEHDEIRVVLVRYKSANQVIPTYGTGDNSLYVNTSVNALRNLNNRHDFIIIKEWNILLNQTNVNSRRVDFYKKLNLVTTIENPEDGATGDEIEENAYYLMTAGRLSPEVANSQLLMNARVRYTDN